MVERERESGGLTKGRESSYKKGRERGEIVNFIALRLRVSGVGIR